MYTSATRCDPSSSSARAVRPRSRRDALLVASPRALPSPVGCNRLLEVVARCALHLDHSIVVASFRRCSVEEGGIVASLRSILGVPVRCRCRSLRAVVAPLRRCSLCATHRCASFLVAPRVQRSLQHRFSLRILAVQLPPGASELYNVRARDSALALTSVSFREKRACV